MTRFARAKGSKASNERIPERATPWHEMKMQLMNKYEEAAENEKRIEADERRANTYQNFLKETEEAQTKNVKWAEFPGVQKKQVNKLKQKRQMKKVVKATNTDGSGSTDDDIAEEEESADDEIAEEFEILKEQIEKRLTEGNEDSDAPDEASTKIEPETPVIKKQKIKKKPLTITVNAEIPLTDAEQSKKEKKLERRRKQKLKKKQYLEANKKALNEKEVNGKKPVEGVTKEARKNKQKVSTQEQINAKKPVEEMTEEERAKYEKHKQKVFVQKQKLREIKEQQKGAGNKNKPAKIKDGIKPDRKKPMNLNSLNINGETVHLAHWDGFPIKKDDYERLVQLEKDMRIKGVPRDEIKRAMKLERRRAERALARLRKLLCFNCRQSGHVLSECPKLADGQETISSGICFKCGSTEHTHFNCRVVRGDQYKYAQCFICKEQGHISRQCPDNNKGLYPRGGACKVCGDVTHLKKDCPKFQAQQEQNAFVAETFDNDNLEGLDGGSGENRQTSVKRVNKIIKF